MLPSFALVFSFVIAQDPAAAPAAPATQAPATPLAAPMSDETKEAIRRAFQNLADAPNYAYELKTEGTGGGFGGGRRNRQEGGGGEGGGGPPAAAPVTAVPVTAVQYERGLPLHVKRGEVEAYVAGEVIVYHDAEKDAWEKFDPQAMRERFGRGPGGQGRGPGGDRAAGGGEGATGGTKPAAGGTPPAAGGEPGKPAPEATSAPGGAAAPSAPPAAASGENRDRGAEMNRMRDLMGMQRVRPLHEIVSDPLKFVAGGEATTTDGKVTIRGALSKEGADSLTSMGFGGGRGGFGGGGDGGGPQREASGTYEIVLDAAGQITSLMLDTTLKIHFEEREMERKSKSTYSVNAIGSTKVEIPEAALVHFEF